MLVLPRDMRARPAQFRGKSRALPPPTAPRRPPRPAALAGERAGTAARARGPGRRGHRPPWLGSAGRMLRPAPPTARVSTPRRAEPPPGSPESRMCSWFLWQSECALGVEDLCSERIFSFFFFHLISSSNTLFLALLLEVGSHRAGGG